MSESIAGPRGANAQSLVDRMRRARSGAARQADDVPPDSPRSDDVDASRSASSPERSIPLDDHLVDRAHQLAEHLLAGRIDPHTARQRMISACLEAFPLDVDRPTAEADLKTVLSGDLQFRAEVDNMLVLAARDLEGNDD